MKPEWIWMKEKVQNRNLCFICGGELIWQNEFTPEEYGYDIEYKGRVIFLSCADCGANVKYESVVRSDE